MCVSIHIARRDCQTLFLAKCIEQFSYEWSQNDGLMITERKNMKKKAFKDQVAIVTGAGEGIGLGNSAPAGVAGRRSIDQ